MKPSISVIIPTYKRTDELLSSIKQVLSQSHKNLELIVVCQSEEFSESFINEIEKQKNDKRFHFFVVDPPSGTAAKNFALSKAVAPIAVILDDDVELDRDLVKMHLKIHSEKPEISALGGRVLQSGFPIKNRILRFDKYGISHGVFTSPLSGYTNAFAGGNCSLKIKDALKVGGFDTRYYKTAFREESDMSMKMVRAGMKILYDPRPTLTHLAAPYGGTRVQGDIKNNRNFYANEMFFTLRAVKTKDILKAISLKHREYTDVVGRRYKLKRNLLFIYGLLAASTRFFRKQRVSKIRAI